MKKIIILCLFLIITSILSAQVIAVRTFDSDTICLEDKTAVMSDLLTDELVHISGITVVEREKIGSILGEIAFQNSGYTDPETVKEQGKMLNADCMIYGNTTYMGGELIVTARMARVESGQILYTARMKCRTWSEFYDKLPKFAQECVNKIPSPNRFIGKWTGDIDDTTYEITFIGNKRCQVTISGSEDDIAAETLNGTYSYSKDNYSGGLLLKVNAKASGSKNKIAWSSFCTFTSDDYSSFNIQIKNASGKAVRASFVKIED
jgi:TolB-like protein